VGPTKYKAVGFNHSTTTFGNANIEASSDNGHTLLWHVKTKRIKQNINSMNPIHIRQNVLTLPSFDIHIP
jgi:hypothetical protein